MYDSITFSNLINLLIGYRIAPPDSWVAVRLKTGIEVIYCAIARQFL